MHGQGVPAGPGTAVPPGSRGRVARCSRPPLGAGPLPPASILAGTQTSWLPLWLAVGSRRTSSRVSMRGEAPAPAHAEGRQRVAGAICRRHRRESAGMPTCARCTGGDQVRPFQMLSLGKLRELIAQGFTRSREAVAVSEPSIASKEFARCSIARIGLARQPTMQKHASESQLPGTDPADLL